MQSKSYAWSSDDVDQASEQGPNSMQNMPILGDLDNYGIGRSSYDYDQPGNGIQKQQAGSYLQRQLDQEHNQLEKEQMAFQMYNFTLAFAAFLLCVSLIIVLVKKRMVNTRGRSNTNFIITSRSQRSTNN